MNHLPHSKCSLACSSHTVLLLSVQSTTKDVLEHLPHMESSHLFNYGVHHIKKIKGAESTGLNEIYIHSLTRYCQEKVKYERTTNGPTEGWTLNSRSQCTSVCEKAMGRNITPTPTMTRMYYFITLPPQY